LNRLTKFIFSIEELYSFILEMLFRKEVLSEVAQLNRTVYFENFVHCAEETLGQAYHLMDNEVCDSRDFIDDDLLHAIDWGISSLTRSLLKLEGLKWLRVDMNKKNINTVEREESACDLGQALPFSFRK
jgi:hypothetical protein